MRFRDRSDAGRRLAERLAADRFHDPLVLALPRGGVPVAFEVAARLRAPLDVFVARKVGAPSHPEYGIGAIAEGGEQVRDPDAASMLGISDVAFASLAAREQDELKRRVAHYRGERRLPDLSEHDVILVDDGLATGVTALVSLRALRRLRPRRLILAAPACAPDTAHRMRTVADDVVCAIAPANFRAVGEWYDDFRQTTDGEVLELLEKAHGSRHADGSYHVEAAHGAPHP
jgi:putative phosphoribosyl transferase